MYGKETTHQPPKSIWPCGHVAWNKAFQEYVELIRFSQSTADPSVYVRIGDSITTVAVHACGRLDPSY